MKPKLIFDTFWETGDFESIDEDNKVVTVSTTPDRKFSYTNYTVVSVFDDPENPETSTISIYHHFTVTQEQIDAMHQSLQRFFGGAPGVTKNLDNGPNHVFGHYVCEPADKVGGGKEGTFTTPNGDSVTIDIPE